MNCLTARTQIPTYRDQALSQADAQAVETHLESCPECRHELAENQRAGAIVEALATLALPTRLEARIRALAPISKPTPERPRVVWQPAAAAAAGFALFVLGAWTYNAASDDSPTPAQSEGERFVSAVMTDLQPYLDLSDHGGLVASALDQLPERHLIDRILSEASR